MNPEQPSERLRSALDAWNALHVAWELGLTALMEPCKAGAHYAPRGVCEHCGSGAYLPPVALTFTPQELKALLAEVDGLRSGVVPPAAAVQLTAAVQPPADGAPAEPLRLTITATTRTGDAVCFTGVAQELWLLAHDLLNVIAVATERAAETLPADWRTAWRDRLVDHYTVRGWTRERGPA